MIPSLKLLLGLSGKGGQGWEVMELLSLGALRKCVGYDALGHGLEMHLAVLD